MVVGNNTLRIIRNSTGYEPHTYGQHSGVPTVTLKLSTGDSNKTDISTINGTFERYGWKEKVRTGFARLRLKGGDPFSDMHTEGLQDFNTLVDPRFVDVEVRGKELDKEPPRSLKNIVDSYSIIIDEDEEFDDGVLQTFADRSRNYGDTEFIFKISKWGQDNWVEKISRNFQMYDSDIWLYPKGRKVHTVAENLERCYKFGKSNVWNVSPRMDILFDYEEEDD